MSPGSPNGFGTRLDATVRGAGAHCVSRGDPPPQQVITLVRRLGHFLGFDGWGTILWSDDGETLNRWHYSNHHAQGFGVMPLSRLSARCARRNPAPTDLGWPKIHTLILSYNGEDVGMDSSSCSGRGRANDAS